MSRRVKPARRRHARGHRTCRTGKVRYPDQQSAIRAMHTIQNGHGRDDTPCRTYECHLCGGWHLTSQPTWGSVA